MTTRVVNDNVPGAVYIGRAVPRRGIKASKWANPYKIGRDGTRADVIGKYWYDLMHGDKRHLLAELSELRESTPHHPARDRGRVRASRSSVPDWKGAHHAAGVTTPPKPVRSGKRTEGQRIAFRGAPQSGAGTTGTSTFPAPTTSSVVP